MFDFSECWRNLASELPESQKLNVFLWIRSCEEDDVYAWGVYTNEYPINYFALFYFHHFRQDEFGYIDLVTTNEFQRFLSKQGIPEYGWNRSDCKKICKHLATWKPDVE